MHSDERVSSDWGIIRRVREYVFGYGSLATLDPVPGRRRRPEGFVADLRGLRRGWGVAMNNVVDLPGYKCYLEPDGRRPALSVCFLDIEPDPSAQARVNGVCTPVDAADLAALDRRERNYERIDVSARIEAARRLEASGRPARVWTYVGSAAGRARFAAGRAAGSAVIDAAYLTAVTAGLRALGSAAWTESASSLDPRGLPVRELVRRELP